jgi:threonine dehydratase
MEQVPGLDAGDRADRRRRHDLGHLPDPVEYAPEVEIYAAEPEQADDAYRSFKAGHIIADDAPVTIADGLEGAAEGPDMAFRGTMSPIS